MQVVKTIDELIRARQSLRGNVGLVPTMGALHEGHLSLVRHAHTQNDAVITTIFINPTQFEQGADLDKYPRTFERDLELLESEAVDLVFAPFPQVMYPEGYQTYVSVESVSQPLEGAHRPGHFRGVATVVLKLFNQTQAHRAYFGQKDAQQVVVIRRMVKDLNVPIEIIPMPIVRESDGLALSSRNIYLSVQERRVANILYRSLKSAAEVYDSGVRNPDTIRDTIQKILIAEPHANVDYISIADPVTLAELYEEINRPVLVSLTVQIGQPRLLDNMLLPINLNTAEGLTKYLGVS